MGVGGLHSANSRFHLPVRVVTKRLSWQMHPGRRHHLRQVILVILSDSQNEVVHIVLRDGLLECGHRPVVRAGFRSVEASAPSGRLRDRRASPRPRLVPDGRGSRTQTESDGARAAGTIAGTPAAGAKAAAPAAGGMARASTAGEESATPLAARGGAATPTAGGGTATAAARGATPAGGGAVSTCPWGAARTGS